MTTAHDVDSRDRLAAANRARWEAKTERMAADLVGRLPEMPDGMLHALAISVLTEHYKRRDR